jgi:ABC-type sugar transport system substrate-binding protein
MVLVALCLAACGSSGSSSGGSSAGSSTSAGAATTAGSSTSAASATSAQTSTTSGGGSSFLAPYKSALAAATKPVAWKGPTAPAPAPKGITVGAVNCSYTVEGCKSGGEAWAAVTKSLGWTDHLIVVDQPNGYEQAMQTLINEHVKAIYLGGIEEQLVPNGIKQAQAAHIPVVSEGSNYAIGGPGQVNADIHAPVADEGKLMADAAMVDHAGNVHALLLQDAEFTEPVAVLKAVKAQFATCKQCKISYAKPINFTATIISSRLPSDVVTAIQSDPATNSIMLGFDPPATFIAPALDSAGDKSKVTMYTQLGDSAPLTLVQQGNVLKYDVASSVRWGVWGDADEVIRYLDHKPLVNEHLPLQMFSSSNPSAVTKLGANDFAAEFVGYEKKYDALWGLK